MPSNLIFFIDLAARSAVVLSIAWGVVMAVPKLSAAMRYWIWLTALCALPLLLLSNALPSVTLFDLGPKAELVAPAPSLPGSDHHQVVSPLSPVQGEATPPSTPPSSDLSPAGAPASAAAAFMPQVGGGLQAPRRAAPVAMTLGVLSSIVLSIYLLGVAALLFPLALGCLRLRSLRQSSRQADPRLACRIERFYAGQAGGLWRRPAVLLSSEITIPLTWGTRSPVILLPEQALGWGASRVAVVLAHESAHIARCDFATGLAASILRAAFWFQPLAWLAHRRLRVEREIAADDRVLQGVAATPPDYAEHLSKVVCGADERHLVAGLAMARPSEIVGRVHAILDSARNRTSISHRMKQRIMLVALVILMPLAFVRCAGEKGKGGINHTTSTGIELKAVDPGGITVILDGVDLVIPAVEKFHMAAHEVTQSEFQEVLGHNPSSTKAAHLPVDRVTRTEAASFCKVLTERDRAAGSLPKGKVYRLPTRSEWLIAGLPGGLVPESGALEAIAWHSDNSAGLLHPVAAKEANAYGLHDMIGNAAEWTDSDDSLSEELAAKTPERYLGRTLLQVFTGMFSDGSDAGETYKSFFQTQLALIQSREVLGQAIAESEPGKVWSPEQLEEAIASLRRNLRARQVRGTDLVELLYYTDSPDEAANMPNLIAVSFQKWTQQRAEASSSQAIEDLNEEVASQEALVEECRERMLELVSTRAGNLVDIGRGGDGGAGQAQLDPLALELEIVVMRNQLESLSQLEGDALVAAAVGLGISQPTLTNRYPEYQTALLQERQLIDSGLGGLHPKVLAARAKIKQLREVLVASIEQAEKALGSKIAVAEKNLVSVVESEERRRADSVEERRRSVDYLAARDEYELHKALLSEMKQRVAISMVDAKLPRHRVAIHERATSAMKVSMAVDGTPSPVGGSAFDDPSELLDLAASAPEDSERIDGVGFRFVMADEP